MSDEKYIPANDEMKALRRVVIVFFAVIFIANACAIYADYFYFADASYFLTSIMAGNVLEGVWRQFPLRVGALLLTQGPAIVMASVDASKSLVKLLYSATFMMFPLMCWILAIKINPSKGVVTSGMIIVGVCCFSTFGFPTETSVSASLLLLLSSLATSDKAIIGNAMLAKAILTGLIALFLFSHEAALLAAPSLLHVFLQGRGMAALGCKRRDVIYIFIALLVLWVLMKASIKPSNAMVAKALEMNSKAIFLIKGTLARPIPAIAFLGVVFACVVTRARDTMRPLLEVVAAIMLVVLATTAWRLDMPGDRYTARAVLVWCMPILPFLPRIGEAAQKPTYRMVFLTVALIFAMNIRSIHEWNMYKSILVAVLTGDAAQINISESAKKELERFRWDWALPYVAATITEKHERKSMDFDIKTWYSPISCVSIRSDTSFDVMFTESEISRLKEEASSRLGC